MKRNLFIVSATLILFAFTSAGNRLPLSQANPIERIRPEASVPPAEGQAVTILFHGLMVGRCVQNARLEVGIVKVIDANDPIHHFNVQIQGGDEEKPCLIDTLEKGLYVFDVEDDNNASTYGLFEGYTPQGEKSFNRKKKDFDQTHEENSYDYRYVPDIEELHKGKVERWDKPFTHIFYVLQGAFKSKCLTGMIEEKKLPDSWSWLHRRSYGYIAEIAGVDITLLPHQQLVLRKKGQDPKAPPVWHCSYSGKPLVVTISNLPDKKMTELKGADYLNEVCKCDQKDNEASDETSPPDSHFQLYYKYAINIGDRNQRFDLRSKIQCQAKTIYPYKCGMILQGQSSKPITEAEINSN
jgi:hypothetical protein